MIILSLFGCDALPEYQPVQEVAADEPEHAWSASRSGWCEAALGGGPGTRTDALAFASAHVGQRLFSPGSDWVEADAILAELGEEAVALSTYADAFSHVCSLPATMRMTGAPVVTVIGTEAWVVPGIGRPILPEGVETVVIDLRDLTADADIRFAASLALREEALLGERSVRRFKGFVDQTSVWSHYESGRVQSALVVPGRAEREYALRFYVPAAISPEAATIAGGLALAGRATLEGHDIHTAVAESTWTGVGDHGLLWRSSYLLDADGEPWPDVIAVDGGHSGAKRPPLEKYSADGWDGGAGAGLTRGQMRAALTVAYGTYDWFYPFFDVVGRDLDAGYLEAMASVDEVPEDDRTAFMAVLGRFVHDLYDGHGFYTDYAPEPGLKYLALQLQEIGGVPVVRASAHDEVWPGDRILSVDGIPIGDWLEEVTSRYSAATDQYRFVQATEELKEVRGQRVLGLERADGAITEVSLAGGNWAATRDVPWGGTHAPSGFLDDLGAPDVYFLNLNYDVTPDDPEVLGEVIDVVTALDPEEDSLILDMRDYPALDYYTLHSYLHTERFTTAQFWFPTWSGPEQYELIEDSWSFSGKASAFTGEIVILTSAKSVSSSEHFTQMLRDLPNVRVVGQTTAGTNGTVTSAWLPGDFAVTFTGMDLRNPDGTQFHGIGIVPDLVVEPTALAFAAGQDPELEAALSWIVGME